MSHEAETTYSKAAKSEHGGDLDQAFRLYVKAAEDFLHLSQISHDVRQRAACKDHAAKALERAEKIKLARPDLTAVARDHFAKKEQLYVLRKSSLVNNIRLPIWDEDMSVAEDVRQPRLSPTQLQNCAVWNRPEDAQFHSVTSPLEPQDISQHIVTDCSVCGSVAVCIAHNRHFQTELTYIRQQWYGPDDMDVPCSPHVQWGTSSTIDDELPSYPDGTLMCLSTGVKRQLWPSLLEKAYMKLMGGYDFPGSDSCVDLHALAGWIPEHVNLKSSISQRERLWSRLAEGFRYGSCMLTLGTGERAETLCSEDINLVPEHCYAVIGVLDNLLDRALTILDSWCHPPSPRIIENGQDSLAGRPGPTNSFILSWESVCNIFDGVYLSWDPGIFKNQITFHGTWKAGLFLDDDETYSSQFQLQLRTGIGKASRSKEEIWIQLTRHVSDTRRTSEYLSLIVNGDEEPIQTSPDLNPLTIKGEYTNNIHTLVRYEASKTNHALHIIAAYEGQLPEVGFTVTVYANTDISWIEEIPRALRSKELDGTFTSKNAGGNHSHPSFMDNPQYHLRIYPDGSSARPVANAKSYASFSLRSPRHIPVNTSLVWSKGERVIELGYNELAASSGPYSYGYTHVVRDLPVGDYTLIVSSFEPQQLGPFKLRVESLSKFDLRPIPQEGAGMFSKVIRGAWTAQTAGGAPSSSTYATNPLYQIQIERTIQLKVRLQLLEPTPPAAINVSLFQHKSPRPSLVATSGPYSSGLAGVATPQIALQPGTYHVVPSTYNPGLLRAFRLIVYSSTAVKLSSLKDE